MASQRDYFDKSDRNNNREDIRSSSKKILRHISITVYEKSKQFIVFLFYL